MKFKKKIKNTLMKIFYNFNQPQGNLLQSFIVSLLYPQQINAMTTMKRRKL